MITLTSRGGIIESDKGTSLRVPRVGLGIIKSTRYLGISTLVIEGIGRGEVTDGELEYDGGGQIRDGNGTPISTL